MPGNGLTFAIKVSREIYGFSLSRGLHDTSDVLLAVLIEFIGHRKIVVRVDRSVSGWQIPDMTVRCQYLEVCPEVPVDGCGFRRRFYDEKFYDSILMIKV